MARIETKAETDEDKDSWDGLNHKEMNQVVRMMNEPKAQKNSGEFLLFGQASYRRRHATKSTFQSGSLRSPFFMHPLEPFSGCIRLVHMLGFPLHVHLYAPLGPPPPGAVPAPTETTTTMMTTIGEDTSKGGWVGALKNRVENRLKVIRTEYESTLTKAR